MWITLCTNECLGPGFLPYPWYHQRYGTNISFTVKVLCFFIKGAGVRQATYFQKTNDHLHELSAKQPDVWYGLAPTSGFLTEFLLSPPRCFGDTYRELKEACPAHRGRGSNISVSCRGRSYIWFFSSGFGSHIPAAPKPDLFSPFMPPSWITSRLCPAPCPKTTGEYGACDGNGSQKQGVGEVMVRVSLSTWSSNWLGKAVTPILKLLKFYNHISLSPLLLMEQRVFPNVFWWSCAHSGSGGDIRKAHPLCGL